MTIHALRLPAGPRTVLVEVFGETAHLEVRPAPGTGDGAEEPMTLEVSARALVAALRAAWADAHAAPTFEPWRHDDRDRRYGPSSSCDGPAPGDLGDGDPDGFRDPSVVPFPYRPHQPRPYPRPYPRRYPSPERPPRPPRSGQPWEPEEEVTVRERWLAASPDADRDTLLAEIALAVERKAGGVAARLTRVGCDPYRPGCTLDPSWDGPGTR